MGDNVIGQRRFAIGDRVRLIGSVGVLLHEQTPFIALESQWELAE